MTNQVAQIRKEAAKARLKAIALKTPMGRAAWAARDACDDDRIGIQCAKGQTRVVLSIPKAGGLCDIKPLSGWISSAQAIVFLEEMATEAVAA